MARSTKQSPIDILLKKNLQIAESTTKDAQGSSIDGTTKKLKRSAKGNGEKTYIKPIEEEYVPRSDNPFDIQKNEDMKKKGKLLKRLRCLGLVPHKYASKASTSLSSLNKRKRQAPRKACPEDEANFLEPLIMNCEYCPSMYFHQYFMEQHLIDHLEFPSCNHCNKPYKRLESLQKHEARCKLRIF